MDEEIYVSCHAPSLSLLLFETARSVHDQKGLLIGQICNEVISKKTDENEVNREHKTAIYLEHCIPLDDELFSSTGIVNKSQLNTYINILEDKIVGWYSFRRNSRLVPNSISEMLIHRSLLELIPNSKSQYFVGCFMSSSIAANLSTHVFNHVFMTFDTLRARFNPLRLKIYTLSDKSVNSNGYLVRNSFPTSMNFNKIINHVQNEESPVKSVLAIQERVTEVLKTVDSKVQSIESHRIQLEQEVECLKRKLAVLNNEEICVEEPPENEDLILKTISYNPHVKYNSNRKVNPLKSMHLEPVQNLKEENRERSPSPGKKPPKHSSEKKNSNPISTNCEKGDVVDVNSDRVEENGAEE